MFTLWLDHFILQLQSQTDSLQSQLDDAERKLQDREKEHSSDLESALIRLEEEQQRWTSFMLFVNFYLNFTSVKKRFRFFPEFFLHVLPPSQILLANFINCRSHFRVTLSKLMRLTFNNQLFGFLLCDLKKNVQPEFNHVWHITEWGLCDFV